MYFHLFYTETKGRIKFLLFMDNYVVIHWDQILLCVAY